MGKFTEVDGEKLTKLRVRKALSQRELGKAAGLAHDTIGQIERGERNAQMKTIRKLSMALGVEPFELMSEENK